MTDRQTDRQTDMKIHGQGAFQLSWLLLCLFEGDGEGRGREREREKVGLKKRKRPIEEGVKKKLTSDR